MKGQFTILLLLSAFFFCSCGAMRVYVNQESKYSRKNPITILNTPDASGALGELQFQLQSNGYKLMSMTAAKKALNLDTDVTSSSIHTELTSTATVSSVYVLEMQYSYVWDLVRYAFNNFSATITDLQSGEIVMTASYSGGNSVKYVIEQLVQEMNKVIR